VSACPPGTVLPPTIGATFTGSCSANDGRAIPASLGVQLWPAAHPQNLRNVDLVVAPLALCQQLASAAACSTAATVVDTMGVTLYAVGTPGSLNMQAAETLTCAP
jgi:hypothetical protein